MRRGKNSALVFPIQGDSSGFRREILAARAEAAKGSASITESLDKVGRSLGRRQGDIKAVSDQFLRFGSSATSALGPVGGLLDGILGAMRGGGPLMLGIVGLGAAVGALAAKLKQAREEAQKLEALEAVTGITRREVDGLRDSLADAGVQLSRVDAAALARVAQQAKISREEIEANARAIQALARLEGIGFDAAAIRFFENLRAGAQASADTIAALHTAIADIEHGQQDPLLVASHERVQRLQEERKELEELRKGLIAAEEATRELYEQRPGDRGRIRDFRDAREALRAFDEGAEGDRLAQIDLEIGSIEELLLAYDEARDRARQAAEEEQKRAAAAQEAKRRQAEAASAAAAREKQALETALAAARARGDAEAVIQLELEKRLHLLDELGRKELISAADLETEKSLANEQAVREREALARDARRRQEDFERAHQARLASLTKSRLDDLEVALEAELAAIERHLEDEVIQVEEAERRKHAIREYYSGLREKTLQEEAAAEKKKEDAAAEKTARAEEQAYSQGIAVGSAMVSGLVHGARQGDGTMVLRGILGAAALAASAFGGPVAGAAASGLASIFAGFFRDGGYVDGPRSAKRDNLLGFFEPGEFIVNREATARSRPLLEAINSGRLPSFAGAFASGGLVGGGGGGGGGTTQVFVAALDPQQTADVLAHRIEPAQRMRGMTRQDEAYLSTVRTRVNRRTGRRR